MYPIISSKFLVLHKIWLKKIFGKKSVFHQMLFIYLFIFTVTDGK